jgi:predicted DNA-binding ribbon-helix-helix protein
VNKSFLLRLDEGLLSRLRNVAEARQVTVSELMREIFTSYLNGENVQAKVREEPTEQVKKKWWE